ncbi:MAG TPA: NRDE family protein [Trebonia sp.]|nr:NRDE family protein [Trebonia sp.]
MCTVVVSFAPAASMPLLLLGVRDEFVGRTWQPPARHWPGSPLIGGRDEQAGGTWLAVHPAVPRVGCILNARGEPATPALRRTRGELPLRAAAEGPAALDELSGNPEALASYDPFHLVGADPAGALVLSWDGTTAVLEDLLPGTHVLTNPGHLYPPPPVTKAATQTATEESTNEAAAEAAAETAALLKAARFGPRFAAHRPSGDPAATMADAWGDWLKLAVGDGLEVTDPAAIIVRRELPDGRTWGSTSVTLVALGTPAPGTPGPGTPALRYDFLPDPADPSAWYPVPV